MIAPLPTPFTDDGATVSEARLSRVIRYLKGKVDGILVNSETGEFSVCTIQERKQLTEIAIRDAQGLPVLVNVSTVGTNAALDLAQHAKRHGARAAVCSPPIYGNYTDEEIVIFFQRMASFSELPIYVVDPSHRLSESVRDQLSNLQPLGWTHSVDRGLYGHGTYTDEFSINSIRVSPLVTFAPEVVGTPKALPYHDLLRSAGSQRLVKAALEHYELECGPLRGPHRWLNHSVELQLKELLKARKPSAPSDQNWPFGSSAA